MDQKLTEEQQRSAHKIIVKNRGVCGTVAIPILNCSQCPNSLDNSGFNCFGSKINPTEFQAENLRRSQAWLDAHITDAEILAETPTEFCERMVRTEGNGKCIPGCEKLCLKCVLNLCETGCSGSIFRFRRAQNYLASHPATPQEPPKRRPKPDEMVVGATVRVRLWDELVKDGVTKYKQNFEEFTPSMKKFCGNTYKIIKRFDGPIFLRVYLENCCIDFGYWYFTTDMLDYVEPEKVVKPKTTAVNFFDWFGKKVVFKDGRNKGAQYTVCGTYRDLDFDGAIHFKTVFFFKLLEIKGASFPAQLFNLCETQDAVKPESIANAPKPEAKEKGDTTVKGDVDKLPLGLLRLINFRDLLPTDALRIISLERQVEDLTKKLAASTKLCEKLQRRLRDNWEAKRDGEMATREEIIAWFDSKKGAAMISYEGSKICPNGHTTWIPATRGNLKL